MYTVAKVDDLFQVLSLSSRLPFPSSRDLAIRYIAEAAPTVTNYGEFDLLLEIAFSLANDHGKLPLHVYDIYAITCTSALYYVRLHSD